MDDIIVYQAWSEGPDGDQRRESLWETSNLEDAKRTVDYLNIVWTTREFFVMELRTKMSRLRDND